MLVVNNCQGIHTSEVIMVQLNIECFGRLCQIPMQQCRKSSTWKRKFIEREEIRKNVIEYAGKNVDGANKVYAWGTAVTGALGIKSYLRPKLKQHKLLRIQQYPARVTFWDTQKIPIKQIACGYGFTVFLAKSDSTHRLFGTGLNTDSQIGSHEYPLKSGRILEHVIQPAPISLPFLKPRTSKIHNAACGRAHTIATTDEGVFSFGNNAYGQCGRMIVPDEQYRGNALIHKIKDLPEDIKEVVCGQDSTLFLTESGEVFSCGLGADGQTGVGHYDCVEKPQKVIGDITGEVITQLSCTADTVLALSDKGDVFAWGNSEYSQLSSITDAPQVNVSRHLPIKHAGKVTMVTAGGSICGLLNSHGEVYVWGYGILGKGPALETCATPQLVPSTLFGKNELQPNTYVKYITSGLSHFAAVTNDKNLYMWGNNKSGALGLGNLKDQYFPLKVSVPGEVDSVCCGYDHTAAILKSYC